MILRNADIAIPKRATASTGAKGKRTDCWNDECCAAVADKRRALNAFKRNLSEVNRQALDVATTHCHATLEKAKADSWELFCQQ